MDYGTPGNGRLPLRIIRGKVATDVSAVARYKPAGQGPEHLSVAALNINLRTFLKCGFSADQALPSGRRARITLMLAEEEIYSLVVAAVNEVLAQAGEERRPLTRSTPLLGDHAILDSVSFVIFIVGLESGMPPSYQFVKSLTEHEGILDPSGPFRTIGTLCDHLLKFNATHVKQS